MNRFSHLIYYVKDVLKTIAFFEKAFGFKPKFIHESNAYAELDTGSTALAFASEELGKMNLPDGSNFTPNFSSEVAFTTSDVQKSFTTALQAGAKKVADPKEKPWGQTVAYVCDPNGILIEIASELT